METFLVRALQLIVSFSFLIVIHELGHFLFARLFKVRVEKFYMFFNPTRSIVRMKKINGKWQVRWFARNVPDPIKPQLNAAGEAVLDEKGRQVYIPMTEEEIAALPDDDWRKYPEKTEWGIGWLPLGGYCRIAGMVDETTGADALQSEPKPWEYRAQPTWKRLPIIIGGVLVNFIAALLIYGCVLYTWGKEYLPLQNAVYGLNYSEVMLQYGFENGDRILQVDGVSMETKSDVLEAILVDGGRDVTVLRGTDTLNVLLPDDFDQIVLASNETDLFEYRFPYVIQEVVADMPAAKALMMAGDSITAINGVATPAFQDAQAEMLKHANDSVTVDFYRAGEAMQARLFIGADGKMGVYCNSPWLYLQTQKQEYGFFEAIPAGISMGWETLASYVKQFKLVFTKEGSKQLGGFGTIGKLFPQIWDWQIFWTMTAFLSIILAFMNILPIPALDGGHVVFLIYEMITGKKPSDKFMERTTTIGFALLFALVIYANLNDIIKAFF